jgi:hypothetical protein
LSVCAMDAVAVIITAINPAAMALCMSATSCLT